MSRRGTRVPARVGLLDPVTDQVETTLFRALAVLRLVVLVYVLALNASRWREFDRPVLGWAVLACLVLWTAFAAWAYDAPHRRGVALLVADLAVALAALAATPVIESVAMLARNASTLPSFWVMAAVLAWAVARGPVAGVLVAALVSAVDVSVRATPTGTTWGNVFLLLVAAGIVGYSSSLIRTATEARAEAERVAAVLSERARLARAVHDGVLQVLALVQRRAPELGPTAADLGRLAGVQEVALRALVQGDATSEPRRRSDPAQETEDLVEVLLRLAAPEVTVSVPADPVRVPTATAGELRDAVVAALDNVSRHVGELAPRWVLLESYGDQVVVTVRDDGPGIGPDRLDQARSEGRLGVSESIRGRLADLGGTATLVSGPGLGTEWELRITR